MSQNVKYILRSLLLTCTISALCGYGGYLFFARSFWGLFALALVAQFILFYFYNSYMERKDILKMLEINAKNNLALSQQSLILPCAYCTTRNTTKISLDQNNTFKCVSCNQVNSVIIQYMSARVTTPINSQLLIPEEVKPNDNTTRTPDRETPQ